MRKAPPQAHCAVTTTSSAILVGGRGTATATAMAVATAMAPVTATAVAAASALLLSLSPAQGGRRGGPCGPGVNARGLGRRVGGPTQSLELRRLFSSRHHIPLYSLVFPCIPYLVRMVCECCEGIQSLRQVIRVVFHVFRAGGGPWYATKAFRGKGIQGNIANIPLYSLTSSHHGFRVL